MLWENPNYLGTPVAGPSWAQFLSNPRPDIRHVREEAAWSYNLSHAIWVMPSCLRIPSSGPRHRGAETSYFHWLCPNSWHKKPISQYLYLCYSFFTQMENTSNFLCLARYFLFLKTQFRPSLLQEAFPKRFSWAKWPFSGLLYFFSIM